MMMDKLFRRQATGLLGLTMILAVSSILPSVVNAENEKKAEENVVIENKENITVDGVDYSKTEDEEKFNQIKESAKYTIIDTDGSVYGYTSKADYKNAQKEFAEKWQEEQPANGDIGIKSDSGVSEFFRDANFQGFLFQQGVGYEWNIPFSYNDTISSMKTAGASSGTQVCYDSYAGEPCKTFPPGQDIPYVGDGWNDQISYVNVLH